MEKCICNLEDGIHEWDCPAVKDSHFYREEKRSTEIDFQLLSELAEQVESEHEGLLPFTAMVHILIEKYNAAQSRPTPRVPDACPYCAGKGEFVNVIGKALRCNHCAGTGQRR